MTKYTNEEIYNALKVISETCEEHSRMFKGEGCDNCPLENCNGDCALFEDDRPSDWVLHNPNKWRAF